VAAVGDPAILATVAAQRGEWAASRGASVVIRPERADPRSLRGVDVVVFPGSALGDLVDAGSLAVLPESLVTPAPREDVLRFAEIAPALRDQAARYGKQRMGLPYGGTALVLAFDRGAFEREANRTDAAGAGLELRPPRTWEELDALARFFQGRDWDGDGAADHGLALPLGLDDAERLGDAIFLARAASLGQHRDHYSFLFHADTMAPRIELPPFVEALQALVALRAAGPPGMEGFDAQAARDSFRAGKTAMLIDRAEMAARWSHGKASIGVAPLPGSARVFDPARKEWEEPASRRNDPSYLPFGGGWLVGIHGAVGEAQREAAIDFARYLIQPETARRVRADDAFPMLPVRSALLDQGPPGTRSALGVDLRQWSGAVSQTLIARRVVPGLRIPHADDYLADLARGRVAAVGGEPTPSALKSVAEAWAGRTEELGEARQTWHYRRSLNELETLPEPPAR
jgi:multiple sugar transport system substrate-binding protein